ncbi:MAG: DUF3795 domain-containing protein [Dehalococcoidales bacterium]|nr:DUF3795 domain-containing protein [Dehalococcoidales bacterium]
MALNDLTAICGPSCTMCGAYIATRSGNRAELERIAAEWTKGLGRVFKPEDIICDGCRVPGGRLSSYCATCEIRLCAQDKGMITCAHCPECPCEKIVAPPAREALATLKKELCL